MAVKILRKTKNPTFVQVPAIVEGNVKSETDQLVTVDVDLLESCDL